LIIGGKHSKPPDHQPLFQGREHRFDGGGFDESGGLPFSNPDVAENWGGT
jgi:hypothetical protein